MNDYPANWPEIALAVKAAADWRCVRCRHPHERPGFAVACDDRCRHVNDHKQRVLTVHHLDGDKANVEWWNLAALCQVCHLHVQATYHPDQIPMFKIEPWLLPYYWARHHQGGQMNICLCGSMAGYPHNPLCPFPYFGHSEKEMDRWQDAQRKLIAKGGNHDQEKQIGLSHLLTEEKPQDRQAPQPGDVQDAPECQEA